MKLWLRQSRSLPLLATLLWLALPQCSPAAVQAAADAGGIVVSGPAGAARLSAAQLRALPAVTINAAFGTAHGPFRAVFSGPLLWTVLQRAGAVDPKQPRLIPREYALLTGADNYSALLALGEMAPVFEDKKIILAVVMNGKDLGPQHLRIVVPGDIKGGRSVRDVAKIEVSLAGQQRP